MPQESLFFYKVEEFDSKPWPNREILSWEEGIGQLKVKNGITILDRLTPTLYYTEIDGQKNPIPRKDGTVSKLNFDHNSFLILTTRLPKTFSELFSYDNTVICSLGGNRPHFAHIEENTVLGRLDGEIENLNSHQLATVLGDEGLKQTFLLSHSPLVSNSDSFELAGNNSSIISNSLLLKSTRSRPQSPQKGTLIYNSRKKAFEGWDGNEWKTLKWE